MSAAFNYYEFFAGAGMARAGLGDAWRCLFANDCDKLKRNAYIENWDGEVFDGRNVASISPADMEGFADLAWASFPCQDLSQAGAGRGIGSADGEDTTRSGALWPFLKIIAALANEGRHPTLLVLENVVGLLTLNGGTNFRAICAALTDIGYAFGAIVADASYFVPQSRPRVFVIGVRREVPLLDVSHRSFPASPWHTNVLVRAKNELGSREAANWVWWDLGAPPANRPISLIDILDVGDAASWDDRAQTERAASWDDRAQTERFTGMMSATHLERLKNAKAADRLTIGNLYLRMRPAEGGGNVQRAEIAFSETIGCLRTPRGGASRPRIIVVHGPNVRTRLVTPREAALLMGLSDGFVMPKTYQESFRLIGDGIAPPVVRFLADKLLEPIATHGRAFVGQIGDRAIA